MLAASGRALAHVPGFLWDAQLLESPYRLSGIGLRSTASYALLSPGQTHTYQLMVETAPLELSVLTLPGETRLLEVTLIDPAGRETKLALVRQPVFEVFTQMRLVRIARHQDTGVEPGPFVVRLTLPEGADSAPFKYVLATGGPERFGPLDVFKTPLWWLQAHLWAWW